MPHTRTLIATPNFHIAHVMQTLVKSFEVTEQPVRTAKFVARKQWVVTGSDDMLIRVYNYNTMDKVKVFEAHTDYIRCVLMFGPIRRK